MARRTTAIGNGSSMHDVWDRGYSVLLTSFWGWTPEKWGTVGWTGDTGRTRRSKLMRAFTDPFITVCYLTKNWPDTEPELRGKIAGFYLVTHEQGDRNDFVDPIYHANDPGKWQHSLRSSHAFTYLPESRLEIERIVPDIQSHAQHIAGFGIEITDPEHLRLLKDTPWVEVRVYAGQNLSKDGTASGDDNGGMVRGGPASHEGYVVSAGTAWLPRDLYILELTGDIDAYRGKPSQGKKIIKIGLAASPALRCQSFQKALPEGGFKWVVERTTTRQFNNPYPNHAVALEGENAMKRYLAKHAKWLGGEFYLVTDDQIDAAWEAGCQAARQAGT